MAMVKRAKIATVYFILTDVLFDASKLKERCRSAGDEQVKVYL